MNSSDIDLPLVSIIAINFNNSKYVIETLDSIDAQTYPNTELIIVDDCSTDDSAQKIANWLIDYKKSFQFIRSPKNEGVCATCNKGYEVARGKYISYIATDDVMLPEKISRQVFFFGLLPDDTGMIYSDAYLIDDDGNELLGTFIQKFRNFDYAPSGNIFETLIQGNFIPAMATMIKSSIFKTVGSFDESLLYEDFDMWLRIAKDYKIIFQNEMTVKYRRRKNSLSSLGRSEKWINSEIKILAKYQENDFVKKRITELILELYINGYDYRELYKKYKLLLTGKGITFKCMKMKIPTPIPKFFLKLFNRI